MIKDVKSGQDYGKKDELEVDVENKDKKIDKDVAKQLVLSGKTPLEQLTKLTRIEYKVGREVLPIYLNEWYQEGVFDFLSCLLSVPEDGLSRALFFRVFDIERNYLDVCCRQSVQVVVDVSEKCYRIAGKDLISSMALGKLRTYLCRYPEDIDGAISHYKAHNPSGEGLSFVWLAALKCNALMYWGKLLSWIDDAKSEDGLIIALHVLTMYPVELDASFVESEVVERILKCRMRCVGDGAKGELCRAATNWSKFVQKDAQIRLHELSKALVHEGSPSVLYYATQNAHQIFEQQLEADVKWSLSEFLKVDLKHKGTLENISFYLQKVVAKFPVQAFEFIEEYCVSHKCKISVFENLCQSLTKCDKCIRDRFFTKWLMSDTTVLARIVHDVASCPYPESRLEIAADFGLLSRAEEEDLILPFLRAIGWLYLMPEACVSFLVSCACLMTVNSLKFVHNDFFYLVVLNYLDLYKSELEKVPREERSRANFKYLKKLAALADDWWKKLKKKGECPELAPSMRHRELCAKHQSEIYGKAMKEAREQSVLSFIARNIQLLHGRGWIVPTFTSEGEKLQESVLKRFSASVRISRLSAIEGHTLETRLTELRRVRREGRV